MISSYTLQAINNHVRRAVESAVDEPLWLRAELAEVRESRGHCYLEFIQKDDDTNAIIARARGQVWAGKWAFLRPHFERATGQRLSAGMQVLVEVRPTFHPVYGYSLNVTDIDPTFTLGDLARRRQEILRQLREAGVADMNRQLPLPRLLQRIAVISSATAAGYQDFCNQLQSNPYGLAFHTQLYAAIMQGDAVEPSIIIALDDIAAEQDRWDCVVIIRGGGAAADLNGFDTLALAENVAQFPLPIITGIGHERDDTVIDLVSHTRVKTPTAAAEFLIQHQLAELTTLLNLADRMHQLVSLRLTDEQQRLARLTEQLPALVRLRRQSEDQRLAMLVQRCTHALHNLLTDHRHRLTLIDTRLHSAEPSNILRLGYSITRLNGKAITDATNVPPGSTITTTLLNGTLTSTT